MWWVGGVWSELVNYFLTRWTLERGLIGSVSKKIESRECKTFDSGDWNSRPRYGLAWLGLAPVADVIQYSMPRAFVQGPFALFWLLVCPLRHSCSVPACGDSRNSPIPYLTPGLACSTAPRLLETVTEFENNDVCDSSQPTKFLADDFKKMRESNSTAA
jgi:hypothetical protein